MRERARRCSRSGGVPLNSFLALLVAGEALACRSGNLFIEAPDVEGAQSYVFAFEQDGQLEVHAFAPESRGAAFSALWFDGGESVELTRLAFRQPLRELGLEAGPLAPSRPPNQPMGDLNPIDVGVAVLTPDAERVRLEPAPASEAVLGFLLPVFINCPRLVAGPHVSSNTPIEALTVDATRVVGLSADEIFLFHADGRIDRWSLPSGEVGGAVALSDRGVVWVATSSAARPFDPASGAFGTPEIPVPVTSAPLGLMVNEGEGPFEVWLLTSDGAVRLSSGDGSEFEVAFELPSGLVRRDHLESPHSAAARFIRLAGSDFLLASDHVALLLERRGAEYRILGAEGTAAGFAGVGKMPDGSVVIAEVLTGSTYHFAERVLELIGLQSTDIRGIASLDGERFVFVTAPGLVGVGFLDSRRCEDQATSAWRRLRSIARLGDDFIVAGVHFSDGFGFGWIRPER